MKLLHNKEVPTEESPIMLQRRHTIMDVDKGCTLAEPNLRELTRSSSTSSLNKTKNKHSEEKAADTTLSPEGSISASNASTVVITESELSSSWLYNNKKAQRKREAGSPRNSPSRIAEVSDEMRSPILPKIRSNSMVGGRTKSSSCCCYALITLVIGVATLGILAAIASIVYMEFFASYNVTDIQITTTKPISQDSVPLKKVGHSLGVETQVLDNAKLPERASESVLFPHSSTKGISSEKQIPVEQVSAVDEKNIVPANETSDSSSVIIDDLLNLTSQMINSVITDQKDIPNPINALFLRNQNLESHYGKLFELYQGLRTAGSSMEKSETSKPTSETRGMSNINISENDDQSDSISLLPVDDKENSNIGEKVNFDTIRDSADAIDISSESEQDSNIGEDVAAKAKESFVNDEDVEKSLSVTDQDLTMVPKNLFEVSDNVAKEFSFLNNMPEDLSEVAEDSSQFRFNNNINNSLNMPHQNPFDKLEVTPKEMPHFNQELDEPETVDDSGNMEALSLKPLPQLPEDNSGFPNSFRTSDVDFEEKTPEDQPGFSDQDQPLANLPIVETTNTSNFIPKFLSQFDRAWGIPNLFRNSDEDSPNSARKEQTSVSADESDSVDLNLPILETNIAVPKPVEMSRHFGKEETENNDLSGDLAEHDRRFSLAKALDRLRLLDANNILPSSRQSKTASQKMKEGPKIQTDLEVATERSHYLENLRKKFFDNE